MAPGASARGAGGTSRTFTGAGSATPEALTDTVGATISVVDRLVAALPGRNSLTVPTTSTESPLWTFGALPVKTNTPSLVAGSVSGAGSSIQKPFFATAMTTPVVVTAVPASGERCAAPWISWIALLGGGGGGVPPELRGFGAPAVKSAALLSVSVAPSARRRSAVVLDRPGAAPAPSNSFALPYPTKSRRSPADETRATLPLPAAIAIEPVTSGVGSGVVPPAPAASCTRKCAPGAMLPDSAVLWKLVPVAAAYCTLQPD